MSVTFKFNEELTEDDVVCYDDPWYDMTSGGYINPDELLADKKQIDLVNKAIETIEDFLEQAENAGILEPR